MRMGKMALAVAGMRSSGMHRMGPLSECSRWCGLERPGGEYVVKKRTSIGDTLTLEESLGADAWRWGRDGTQVNDLDGYTAGMKLDVASMFAEGDLLDVQGTSVGKGFQVPSPSLCSMRAAAGAGSPARAHAASGGGSPHTESRIWHALTRRT